MLANPNPCTFNSSLKPLVSWILCCHILNNHLKVAIESCLNQSYKNFELVIVANGADSQEIYRAVEGWFGSDNRIRVFVTEVQQLSFSLSLGLHNSRGSLVARMDSDDISYSDRLQRQVDYMCEHPGIAVLGSDYQIIDNEGIGQRKVILPKLDSAIRKALFYGNPLCHPSIMFRREIILQAGGYLGGLHAEDYDLWARLSLNPKYQFANLDSILIGYRVIGVGAARRSRWAYASMSSSQFRNFLVGGGGWWLFASLISVFKLVVRSSRIGSNK